MLSPAENRLCMQTLLTWGRGTIRQWFQPGCGAQTLWQQGARKAPTRVQMQVSGGDPKLHERRQPCLCQAQWSLWGWPALGSPCPSATWPEGQPRSKPRVRSGCDQMYRGICQGMREVKDQLLPFPSHPRTGSWEHPAPGVRWGEQPCPFCEKPKIGSV